MPDGSAERAKAYSYLRFSTPDQMRGDSFRRQTEAARAYAERHGLELDDSLTFRDLGVSAFRGANVVDGALGQFIAAVDSGRVRPGSYLLVENLDRLSRDKIMAALNRFSSLLEKGVTVVTLSDGKVYTAESLNNLPDLMLSLLVMSRAHEESDMKSRRVRAAWQAKRDRAAAGGHILTAKAPAWLRVRDGAFEVVEERAAVVRRIFAMALEGHGKGAIASRLNAEGVEPFGDGPSQARKANGWHASYVRKILSNEAVIGRFQPMRRVWVDGKKTREPDGAPINGYFPAILADTDDFYRARRAPPAASGRKGRPLANLLSGLVRCHLCDGPMHFVSKGPAPKGGDYLACDNARRKGTCDAKAVRYGVVVSAILNSLDDSDLDVRALLAEGQDDPRPELMRRIEAAEARIADTETAIANLLDTLQRVPSPSIEARIAENEAALVALRRSKDALDDELRAAVDGADSPGDLVDEIGELNRRIEASDDDVSSRLHAMLGRLVDRVTVGRGPGKRQEELELRWTEDVIDGQALPGERLWFAHYDTIRGLSDVFVDVAFRARGRHMVIYADARRQDCFVAAAVRTGDGGAVESFRLKPPPDLKISVR